MTAATAAPGLKPLHRQPLFLRFWSAQTVSVFGYQVSALVALIDLRLIPPLRWNGLALRTALAYD